MKPGFVASAGEAGCESILTSDATAPMAPLTCYRAARCRISWRSRFCFRRSVFQLPHFSLVRLPAALLKIGLAHPIPDRRRRRSELS
jgi:hypothetical protein